MIDVRDPADVQNNRAILIEGKAKIFGLIDAISNLPKLVKLRSLFYGKYPHYMRKYVEERDRLPPAWRTSIFLSRLIVRIDMEKFAYWRRAHRIYLPL